MSAFLSRITVYPLKSGDGIDLTESRVLGSGALEHDRRFALVDSEGRFVNGKRTPAMHRLRTTVDVASRTLRLVVEGEEHEFSLDSERLALETCLSEIVGIPATLVEDVGVGFPDDLDSPGPTLISTATLECVAGWFPGLSLESVRRRFRANLEIGGVEPFWEDRLYGAAGTRVPFRVGAIGFLGNNPCQRCAVPARDPLTGEVFPSFVATFRTQREQNLPGWAERQRFDHFFRLAVNTVPASPVGGWLRTGDAVES